MKIGILTFHWGTNYGAVIQAFALCRYLNGLGHGTEIINYSPKVIKFNRFKNNLRSLNFRDIIKEFKLKIFRKKWLNLSKAIYNNKSDLKQINNYYDLYICGSDQIWNEWFTLNAEKEPTLSYYFDFVDIQIPRASYAASFGTEKLPENMIKIILPELKKFSHISVREYTGKKIIEDMGFKAEIVADPTLLINRRIYQKIYANTKIKKRYHLFSYILHRNQRNVHEIKEYLFEKHYKPTGKVKYENEPLSMEEWLYNFENSDFVLTNSYHGVIFSIIYHKSFIATYTEGAKMNDRLDTLLKALGLKYRIAGSFEKDKIDYIYNLNIDWQEIDIKLAKLRESSIEFLERAIKLNQIADIQT